MKLFIVFLMVLMAIPCAAAIVTPPCLLDGNANLVPQYFNGTEWVLDTGTVNTVGTITATVTTAPSTWSDSVTIRGTGSGNAVPVTGTFYQATQPVNTAAYTIDYCTSVIVDSTVKTIDLGDTFREVRLFSDTVCVVNFNFGADPSSTFGDPIADDFIPYVGVAYRYIKVTTYYQVPGASGTARIRVRGMR